MLPLCLAQLHCYWHAAGPRSDLFYPRARKRPSPDPRNSNMDVEEDSEEPPHSPQKAITLHAHRLDHNPSKLPAFRFVDLNRAPLAVSTLLSPDSERATAIHATKQGTTSSLGDEVLNTTASTPIRPYSPTKRPSTSPGDSVGGNYFPVTPSQPEPALVPRLQDKRLRRAPASHSSNGIETATGPPPALSTQRSSAGESPRIPNTSTTEWALAQQQLTFQTLNSQATPIIDAKTTNNTRNLRGASKSLDESTSTKPLIPPIRSFRSSTTRASLEMNARSFHRFETQADDEDFDRDRTLRALEGYSDNARSAQSSQATDQDGQRQSDAVTEDLFLNLARNDLENQGNNGMRDGSSYTERRRVSHNFQLSSFRSRLPFLPSDRCAQATIPPVISLTISSLELHWQAIVSPFHLLLALISSPRASQCLVADLMSEAYQRLHQGVTIWKLHK